MRKPPPPAKRGRPPTAGTGTRRINVSLDAATVDRARQLGAGNLSEGLRVAVAGACNPPPAPEK